MSCFLGIDPGVAGGLALIAENGRPLTAPKMPATERELCDVVYQLAAAAELHGMIEKLGAMPRRTATVRCEYCGASWTESKPLQSPSTMLMMGTNYGGLRMALAAAGIAFDEVLPRTWQAAFGLVSSRNLTSTQKKNRHKAKAEQLFPSVRVTHYIADALLIAEYCRRMYHVGSTGLK